MALIIRMRQQGTRSRQRFRLVVTDSKTRRDGKYVEMLGWYNPFGETDKNYSLDIPRIQYWLDHGAEISDRVKSLVNRFAPDVVKALTAKRVAKVAKRREKRKEVAG